MSAMARTPQTEQPPKEDKNEKTFVYYNFSVVRYLDWCRNGSQKKHIVITP